MSKEYDLLVCIMRAQPFHVEHKRMVDEALSKADNVLILLGSSGRARSVRNPFTFEERAGMIFGVYNDTDDQFRLSIAPLRDITYNDAAWIKQVQELVKDKALEIANSGGFANHGTADVKIGLVSASKDKTSYYNKLFPQWGYVDVGIKNELHATYIREGYFAGRFAKHELSSNELPPSVANYLFDEFIHSEAYAHIKSEQEHVTKYKQQWANSPYEVKHLTCDVLLEQSGHILLIKRRAAPGKNTWALPGGHLEIDETLEDGCIRELFEETKIKVPEKVLRGNIINRRVFDDPHRSQIGRVVTYAIHIKLPDDEKLPRVKGSDDACAAKWIPIGELREDNMHDDHFQIALTMLGI